MQLFKNRQHTSETRGEIALLPAAPAKPLPRELRIIEAGGLEDYSAVQTTSGFCLLNSCKNRCSPS